MDHLATQRSRSSLTFVGRLYAIVLAFVLGGAMIRDINLLLIVAGVMLGPLLLGWRVVREVTRNLKVSRILPEVISSNEVIHIQITLWNLMRRRGIWGIAAHDQIRKVDPKGTEETNGVHLLFPFIPPQGSASESYTARILDRGRYEFGPLILKTRFPMGLVESNLATTEKRELIVHPRIGTLLPDWTRAVSPMQVGARTQRGEHTQAEGEFHSLRDFRPGDSRRWIHWRSSAKRRKLTVRQFQRWQHDDLAIVLELPSQDPLTEMAIRFVATLCRNQCRQGQSRLLVAICGRKLQIVHGAASSGLFKDLMYQLALVEPTDEDVLAVALRSAAEYLREDARLLLVSPHEIETHDTQRFADAWDQVRMRPFLARAQKIRVGSDEFFQAYRDNE